MGWKSSGREVTEILRYVDRVPIIRAYNIKHRAVFWCAFCARPHIHALAEGHHVAHCHHPHSPFEERGYILEIER